MMERIREIVVEDFEISEIGPIEKHIEEVKKIKGNVDSLSKALSKLQSFGVKSVISVKKEDNIIRLPASEFIFISDCGEPKIMNTHSGKVGVMDLGGTTVKAFLNDESYKGSKFT